MIRRSTPILDDLAAKVLANEQQRLSEVVRCVRPPGFRKPAYPLAEFRPATDADRELAQKVLENAGKRRGGQRIHTGPPESPAKRREDYLRAVGREEPLALPALKKLVQKQRDVRRSRTSAGV
jgi:hypothetical protein